MTTTVADLVVQVQAALSAYGSLHPQTTWLTAPCTDADTTLSVNDSSIVTAGLIEIDGELMEVANQDDNGTVTLSPFGRGQEGTAAAAHAANTKVTVAPVFPCQRVFERVAQTVEGLWPDLYAVAETDLTAQSAVVGYDVPAEAERILSVTQQTVGPYNYWQPVRAYRLRRGADNTTGRMLDLFGAVLPGQTVHVVYAQPITVPATRTDPTDITALGLTGPVQEIVVYGTAASLIRFADAAIFDLTSVPNAVQSMVSAGRATTVADHLYAVFQDKITRERRRLLHLYPTAVYYQE